MESHHRQLGRGFAWLGGATIIAKVVDFSMMPGITLFLTKQQVGVASLVVSIRMVVEAFDGLGTGEALVQAPSVFHLQLDRLFWFVLGAAVVVAGVTVGIGPTVLILEPACPLVGGSAAEIRIGIVLAATVLTHASRP